VANKDRAAVESGLSDLLGSVIQTDREASGRSRHLPPPAPPPSAVSEEPLVAEPPPRLEYAAPQRSRPARIKPAVAPAARQRSAPAIAEERLSDAIEMSESARTTVTFRIPIEFNEWIDEYVHRSWPKKVKKQDLLIEALLMLYVRRGRQGDEILETNLLPPRPR
jgi:hypothetical protein